MSGRASGWVIRNFPVTKAADRNRKLIFVAVADVANQFGEHASPGIDPICAEWAFDRATVTRHLTALVRDGWLEVTKKGGRGRGDLTEYCIPGMRPKAAQIAPLKAGQIAVLDETEGSQFPGLSSAESPSSPYLNGSNGIETTVASAPARSTRPKRAPRENEERARQLTERVWRTKKPPPVQKFIAIVQIAERFLDNGYGALDVERAMCQVPTISIGWVEAEIAKTKPRPSSQVVDDDRAAPTGKVKL